MPLIAKCRTTPCGLFVGGPSRSRCAPGGVEFRLPLHTSGPLAPLILKSGRRSPAGDRQFLDRASDPRGAVARGLREQLIFHETHTPIHIEHIGFVLRRPHADLEIRLLRILRIKEDEANAEDPAERVEPRDVVFEVPISRGPRYRSAFPDGHSKSAHTGK